VSQTTGPTVRKVLNAGSLNTVQKGVCKSDVCTEADLRIQKTIQENLREIFPRSKIICEEEDSSIDSSIKAVISPD
jgi:fructose-1,6-bisphosphatase/inositol monophosphatase family enzyme